MNGDGLLRPNGRQDFLKNIGTHIANDLWSNIHAGQLTER
ncbi:hypothetical protein Salmuc_01311 [Salipiger mucosus DSM 16094]|uniref:Uncharacterized protein n=1 Tax=Salipiger mucosus DSM 16094 TaxID=1123237 RepID=S9QYM0_9RHOB|nr:hypothetical protein Salmuc_01311 [Salipiger mucosus DSM 16094]